VLSKLLELATVLRIAGLFLDLNSAAVRASRSNPEPQHAACAIGAPAGRQAVGTLGLYVA
jgi:hypothetical protein